LLALKVENSIVLDFMFNLILSVVSGIYAGLIVSRFVKFEDIRKEVKRVVHDIDFMNEGPNGELVMINEARINDLHHCMSELLYLKHKNAANIVGSLISAISNAKSQAGKPTGDVGDFYQIWQSMVRKMTPDIKVLLSLKPKV
jgi:hypothetical protein